MLRGIDITTLDLMPSELTKSNGFNHPVMEFTCNTARKWSHPADPSILYDVPDQVETINSLPGGVVDYKNSLYHNNEDIKKSMSVNLGIEPVSGMFSLSGSYAKGQQMILENVNSIAEQSAYVSGYEVEFQPHWKLKLGSTAQTFVDQFLPPTYAANPDKYQEFLQTFGTHFFDTGYYGGYLTNKIEISEALSEKMKESEIKVQAEYTFLNALKLKGGYTGAVGAISNDFKANTRSREAYYGGNINLLSGGAAAYTQWWNTVARNPWLFGGKLLPITDLIAAGTKRDAIIQATNVLLDKAYIDDLIRSLEYVSKLTLTNKPGAQSFINQLNAIKAQVIPNDAQLVALAAQVNAFVMSERNKTSQDCHKVRVLGVVIRTECNTIHNHEF